jgi:adenylate cyclase
MADIFVSYARSTANQAQQIAQALRALGYEVWRDDELPAHRAYAEVIEERLKAAKAVVVVWSAEAVKSEWVQSEADRARNDRKLVQVTVDGAQLPMPFDRIQCADLSGWAGDLAAVGWRKVVSSIADLVGSTSPVNTQSMQSERRGISVCVLPFANMSADAEQEYFSDGISEDIITDLSKVSTLWVAARNTAFTFKGKHVDVPQVARQLKCSHVLEGSVRKSGNRVRITAQLIDGATGGHVWAERYDRPLDDIFALQDEISQEIVAALKLKLLPEEKKAIGSRGTDNVEAYDLYLRAQAFVHQGGPANVRACELLRAALGLDPEFARAWAELAIAHANAQIFSTQDWAAALREIDEPVRRALRLGPGLPVSHIAQGVQFVWLRDWRGAEQAFTKAVTLAPSAESNATAAYGAFLSRVGRIPEAIDQYLNARRADPLAMSISANLQAQLTFVGRYVEAETQYERSKDLAGDREAIEHMALMRL